MLHYVLIELCIFVPELIPPSVATYCPVPCQPWNNMVVVKAYTHPKPLTLKATVS